MKRITLDVNTIVNELRSGHVAALPTETVYGLGADATNHHAVEQIFKIKHRPLNHPLIMHVAPSWDLERWIEPAPNYAKDLINAFWPGPLTLIFKLNKQANLSKLITANQTTIAIRCPNHPLTLAVLNQLDRPIVAPSANPFGRISPTKAQHVLQDFPQDTFSILDGGTCSVGIESTILYCIDDHHCTILRHGIIHQTQIQPFCPVSEPSDYHKSVKTSGHLKHHYQPHKPLIYITEQDTDFLKKIYRQKEQYYLLGFSNLIAQDKLDYRFPACPKKAAMAFYHQLRQADHTHHQQIIIELPANHSAWQGLIDRIKKAGRPVHI